MLDVLVKACAVTVTVEFYLIGLPILYFLGYTKSTVILTTALAYCTLLTCVLKDICCGPRPAHMLLPDPAAPAPEDLKPTRKLLTHLKKGAIAVLETPRDVEYGAPSMHTSLALTMNLCCARLASHYVYAQAAAAGAAGAALGNPTGLGVVGTAWLVQQLGVQTAAHVVAGVLHGVALCWSAWIAWSRLYLGESRPWMAHCSFKERLLQLLHCSPTCLLTQLVALLLHCVCSHLFAHTHLLGMLGCRRALLAMQCLACTVSERDARYTAPFHLPTGVHTPVDLGLGAVVGSSLVATLGGPMGRVWLDAILDLTPALWWQVRREHCQLTLPTVHEVFVCWLFVVVACYTPTRAVFVTPVHTSGIGILSVHSPLDNDAGGSCCLAALGLSQAHWLHLQVRLTSGWISPSHILTQLSHPKQSSQQQQLDRECIVHCDCIVHSIDRGSVSVGGVALAVASLLCTRTVSPCQCQLVHLTPAPSPPCSYQYAVTFLGAHTGFAAGISHAWRGCYIQRVMHSLVLNLLPVSALPTLHLLAEPPSPVWWVARCVMGLVAVLLTREVFTTVLKAVLPPLFEMVPAKIRTLYQPPINFGKLPAFHADGSPANDKENVPGMSGGTGQHMFADGTAAVAYISAVKGGEEGDGLRRRGGQASASVTAVAGGVIGADPHAVVDGKGRHVGGTVRADGVLLREDGKAWDADTVRRFVTYGAAVWSLAEYTWLLMAAGAS